MIRKMLFAAGAISLASLITVGLTLGLPAGAKTTTAANAAAAQGCNFQIPINKIDLGPRRVGGGHQVGVFWGAPSNLPDCVSVASYNVSVTIKLPNATRQQQESVAGNSTSASLLVRGTPLDRDPQTVTATVTAVLKTNATAKGSKSEQVKITP